jgi:glycosyltransferase involved in cell wall biosynthesis
MPKISVCSSTYNHEKYVVDAIQSVLNQTCQDFELIITDDASTDGNVAKIRTIKDPRIMLFCHDSNRGNMVASQTCFDHSSGQYLVYLTTDDIFEPDMFEVLSQYLDQHPDALGVFGQATFIDEDGKSFDHTYPENDGGVGLDRFQQLNNLFWIVNYFCCPAAMIRRSSFEKVGYFLPYLRQTHDLAHWIRLLFQGDLPILSNRLLKFRIRANDANAGSLTPETWRRIDFEVFENLQVYVDNIRDTALLCKIFPKAKEHPWPLEDELIPFHIAHIALSRQSAVHRLFGLRLLYRLMSDRNTADYLRTKCKFDYPDMFRLQGEKPLFADYRELGKDEAQLRKKIDSLRQQLVNSCTENYEFAEREIQLCNEIELLRQELKDSRAHCEQLETAYQALLNSASWKATSFLRQVKSVLVK